MLWVTRQEMCQNYYFKSSCRRMKLFNLHYKTDHHLHRHTGAGSQCVKPSNPLQTLLQPATREKRKHDTKLMSSCLIIFAFTRLFRMSPDAPAGQRFMLDLRLGPCWSCCGERAHVWNGQRQLWQDDSSLFHSFPPTHAQERVTKGKPWTTKFECAESTTVRFLSV